MVDLSAIDQEITLNQRIADLEARVAFQAKQIECLQSGLDALEVFVKERAKPKTGNKQGYPSEGVVWDGQVRLMAKAYGFTAAEIDDMQEGMDTYFLSLVGTSKAKVSSDWQLNARTWIKNTAKREGRTRQDAPQAGHQDSPAPESKHTRAAVEALAANLMPVESDEERDKLERHTTARRIRDAYARPSEDDTASPERKDISILSACGRSEYFTPFVRNMEPGMREKALKNTQRVMMDRAAKLDSPIGRERFAWPKI